MIKTATDLIPAVAYLRRSTDKQEQSLGDQRLEVVRFAEENGYQIIREYVDDAITGTSANGRRGFLQMIKDAQARQFKAVIVWNSDRFSRGDVTETEHYRYLLREAGVTVLSVTEDYLHRESFDGDILRTVKQFQNRQFSISLSQNTLRGQVSAVQAESDPGRPCPYGYDREIVGPDGAFLYRVRHFPGQVRKVLDKDGNVTAVYRKGQTLRKPGKDCKGRLVLSEPQRVQTVRDIFAWCLDGVGFFGIADRLNARGLPSPRGNLWAHTTVKAIIENPVYRGDLVWNRRTESKFYAVKGGRVDKMKQREESGKPRLLPEEDWIVIRDVLPAIVSREDWDRAQVMVMRRCQVVGGLGQQARLWLLSGVLHCGCCGSRFWGEAKRKGGSTIVTKYYVCSGRRRHGKSTCPTPLHVKSEPLEKFALETVGRLIFADAGGVEAAVEKFVASVTGGSAAKAQAKRLERDIYELDQTVASLTENLDPANLALLNSKLTQLRRRREHLEAELRNLRLETGGTDEEEIRRWARKRIAVFAETMDGRRDFQARQIVATYIEKIIVTPETREGEIHLNPVAYGELDLATLERNGVRACDEPEDERIACSDEASNDAPSVNENATGSYAGGGDVAIAGARYLRRFRIVQWFMPLFTWELWRGSPAETPHPYDLLARERALRCVLLSVVAVEWLALLVIGFSVGVSCLLERGSSHYLVGLSLAVLVLASFPAMVLHSCYKNLGTRWQELNAPLCPRCGYDRRHSTGLVCNECGSTEPVVPAGQMPRSWARWQVLSSETAVFVPFAILGSLTPLLMFASRHLPVRVMGGVILLLTVSVLAIVVAGVLSMAGRDRLPRRKS
ncbi:MAG TPA: recombinase family protein [Phycisphaerae bacterium]|nr:recombinase family protein [Phycisphaerae bacterium]HOL28291.1 recombinase family protein [Phycisphaerae bacterium]HPP19914.1 recombinase family protein [Phycisphaerae bacterium]HPU34764.1 recombinase family protein [Phycisphaerae bacterium]HQE45237.1 recombinase family protein [Phycisphaerae bacterium]